MPKSPNQKQRPFALLELLRRESDEQHPLSVPTMVAALGRQGIAVERKTLYDDIETLRARGWDIVLVRGVGYYLAEDSFALAELKLLVDAVQASKFISERKARTLIGKLSEQCSRYQASALQRQVYVSGRVRTENEAVLYSIDALHEAISTGRRVTFRYFNYNEKKNRQFHRNGASYTVSPVGLLRNDAFYYLVALENGQRRHYRVDRMTQLHVLEDKADPARAKIDMEAYTRRHFSMYGGEELRVTLRCVNTLSSVIIDQFGQDVMLIPDGKHHFTVTETVAVSGQFYGWLFGLGTEVEVLAPETVRAQYRAQLNACIALHNAAEYTNEGEST